MTEQLNFDWDEGPGEQALAPGALLLRRFALPDVPRLLTEVAQVTAAAPFRHMSTPGGLPMSVALTCCGALGWVSDRAGYRYVPRDPETGKAWPALPTTLFALSQRAARKAGYADFAPDTCLVNRYVPGSRLTLHQDKNERDFSAPIVSISLGLSAVFLFGGELRSERAARIPLHHADVVVWGGPSRLRYHGVLPLAEGHHPLLGAVRINLTLRTAG